MEVRRDRGMQVLEHRASLLTARRDHRPNPLAPAIACLTPRANRQRIAQLGASLVRHRISPRNVGLNRHFLRGLVAVLSPLRPPGTSPWSVQPRPWSSFVAGVSPGDLLVFPWGLPHRLADALSRGSAQAWEPKCREQPSPPP